MKKYRRILILIGHDPQKASGGAATWAMNIDPFLRKDFQIDYLIVPEFWLNITWIPDRIKASIQAFFVLLFKRHKWDIFFSHSPELAYVATLFSKNIIHIAHGNTNPVVNPTFRIGKIFFPLFEYFDRKIEQKVKLLYTVGEERKGYKKINQPINHTILPLSHENKHGIIFAGRLEKVKNIDFIIRAYHLVSQEILNKNVFHIYGYGTQEIYLRKLVSDLDLEQYVFFHGHIKNEYLISEINKSALLVMASSFEGFPMVIAESLTVGTPVLSTNVGAIANVIVDGYNGFCIPKEVDHKEYAHKMEEILINIHSFCSNALLSSKIFNAADIYEQLKGDINRTFFGHENVININMKKNGTRRL
jgi:glycosyltransferase involved in cell wall biosynthesis